MTSRAILNGWPLTGGGPGYAPARPVPALLPPGYRYVTVNGGATYVTFNGQYVIVKG